MLEQTRIKKVPMDFCTIWAKLVQPSSCLIGYTRLYTKYIVKLRVDEKMCLTHIYKYNI